jgi:fatty acid desaturase
MEVFRGTHLAHHRWLNTSLDPARESDGRTRGKGWIATLSALEAVQSLAYLRDALAGGKPYVRRLRIAASFLISLATVLLWVLAGHPEIVGKMLTVTLFTTLIPISFRGAVEHYSFPGDTESTNEYRVWIPLFNLNRHVHHHERPYVPWYLLEFRTENPLSHWRYFTHWFRVYVTREFVLMRPERERASEAGPATRQATDPGRPPGQSA